jgi:phospholipase C
MRDEMTGADGVQHIFVLMLENRSFDHMLGFWGLAGLDAETGAETTIHGLTGNESNNFEGQNYCVSQGADYVMPVDPHHEFLDILHQLCGPRATYLVGGKYASVDNSGFVPSYVASGGSRNPGEIMKCFSPQQLPVLYALATEFAVCDNWHASMPGPTWPNRMFIHAGSSGGLDHSPTVAEIVEWEIIRCDERVALPVFALPIFDTAR